MAPVVNQPNKHMSEPKTAGQRVGEWLDANPEGTKRIALAAIGGLYLDEKWENALPENDCFPRGSSCDYVDEVGDAIEYCGALRLINDLQAEVPDEED